jgi:hypothetical protein
VKFLGQSLSKEGIQADPEKTRAIAEIDTPQTVSDLRRFLGMVNQLGKYSPRISELTQPLRELLRAKKKWLWGVAQDQAFSEVKPTILTMHNPEADLKFSADTS